MKNINDIIMTYNDTHTSMVNGFQEKAKLVKLYEAIHKVELEIIDGDYVIKWGNPEYDTICSKDNWNYLLEDCYKCIFRYWLLNDNVELILRTDFPDRYINYMELWWESKDDSDMWWQSKSEDGY